jgi:hypothetical protein
VAQPGNKKRGTQNHSTSGKPQIVALFDEYQTIKENARQAFDDFSNMLNRTDLSRLLPDDAARAALIFRFRGWQCPS